MASNEFRHKVLRDSIYGYVGVSETELDIINTMAFQRLQRIKQLSFSDLAYHTATHTRYAHAIGTMHMAGRMCDQLGLDTESKRLARLAALLHDIGHGPFSHTFEKILEELNPGKPHIHEFVGRKMIVDDGEISDCLKDTRHTVAAILKGPDELNRQYSLISSIVSGNLDADKLDYFARDSHSLGVKYGVVDTERILHVLRHDEQKMHLGVHPKGIPVLDSYRLARYMIGKQVYTHRVRLAADKMFYCAVDSAFDEDVLDKKDFDVDSDGFLEFYRDLDDYSFVHKIMWDEKSVLSREILDNIRRRKLLKACYHGSVVNTSVDSKARQVLDTPVVLGNAAAEIRKRLGLRDHEVVMHESDLEIRLFKNDAFLVFDDQGKPHEIGDHSPLQTSVSVLSYYVFGVDDKRKEITQMLKGMGINTLL